MAKVKYLVKHEGFNRAQRRHDSNVQMLIDKAVEYGKPIPKNKPYEKKIDAIK